MKKPLVVALLLACLPASAFGVSLSLQVGGSGNHDVLEGSAGTITVDFLLQTTQDVDGYTTKLKASHAGVLTATARTLNSPLDNPTTADGVLLPLAIGTAWSASDVGASWDEVSKVSSDTIVASWTVDYDVSGLALGTVVSLMPGLPGAPPMFIDIDGGRWSFDGVSQNMDGGTALTLTVVPEPMSAMLLLAAVPFLWRRRTA
jgi:hypothetical protein